MLLVIRSKYLENKINKQEEEINRGLVLVKADTESRAIHKLKIKTLHKGDITNFPKVGDTVTIQYTGKLTNGTVFDSSLNKGHPFKFIVGLNQVIKGLDIAILKLSKGQRAEIFIPAILAYGEKGAGNGKIPPNSNLIFDIRLIGIKKNKITIKQH